MNNRAVCLLGGLAGIVLMLGGCGKSSTGASTVSSTSEPANAASSTSPAKPFPTSTSGSRTVTIAPATPTARLVSGSADGVVATLRASTHTPTVNRPWPLHLTVTRGAAPVKATVEYEYLFGGQVVAHRSHYAFTGHFSDQLRWPSSAVGYPLTFRAAIVSQGATINLDYPVQVTR